MAYFANGTEGLRLDAQCDDCPLGAGWHDDPDRDDDQPMLPCPTAFVQMNYNYDQVGNDDLRECLNRLVEDGTGTCKTRELLAEQRY